jgi:hypothetical protein
LRECEDDESDCESYAITDRSRYEIRSSSSVSVNEVEGVSETDEETRDDDVPEPEHGITLITTCGQYIKVQGWDL